MKKNKKSSLGKSLKKGVVLGAVAAGAYALLGPDGKKNQAKLKKVVKKVKGEVLKGAKIAKKEFFEEAEEMKKEIKKAVKKGAGKVNKW